MRFAKPLTLCVTLICGIGTATAGTTTFPGATEFTFSGYPSGGYNWLSVCVPSATCHVASGDSRWGGVISTQADQVQSGSVVRGTLEAQDPQGSQTYYSMEFELDTQDFFLRNPGAHIAVAPRAFLPFLRTDPGYEGSPYHGYTPFLTLPGMSPPLKVPHAYGNGIILGSVPCMNGLPSLPSPSGAYQSTVTNGIAIEHFIGPANTDPRSSAPGVSSNLTACPSVRTIGGVATASPAQLAFDNYATYSVKVFVKQYPCPNSGASCRTVGYAIQKVAPVFGSTPVIKGGGDEASFPDTSDGAPSWGNPARSWGALQPIDRSSWFISNIFTANNATWSYQIRNLQVTASSTAPSWWTTP